MKTKQIFIMLLITFGIIACKKSEEPFFPSQLNTLETSLTASFDSLNANLASSATLIASNIGDTAQIRNEMLDLANGSSFVLEFGFVTPAGIMQIVEPEIYHPFQGTDMSQESQFIKAVETKLPAISEAYIAQEGFWAAIMLHPILKNNQFVGGISGFFPTAPILERNVTPLVTGQTFEIWIMEKGGIVLYDQDVEEIGLNVLTDPLYQDFPELIAAAQLIDSEQSGVTKYSFYQTGTTIKVTKKTYWTTFEVYNTEWKLIWVKPE